MNQIKTIKKRTEQSRSKFGTSEAIYGNADAIRAFRSYARLYLDRDTLPPHMKYSRIRGVCRTEAEAMSMLAVCDTLRILRLTKKHATLYAVRKIWMADCFAPLHKQVLGTRIRKTAASLFCDERTVYRYLRTAADIYREILKENATSPL